MGWIKKGSFGKKKPSGAGECLGRRIIILTYRYAKHHSAQPIGPIVSPRVSRSLEVTRGPQRDLSWPHMTSPDNTRHMFLSQFYMLDSNSSSIFCPKESIFSFLHPEKSSGTNRDAGKGVQLSRRCGQVWSKHDQIQTMQSQCTVITVCLLCPGCDLQSLSLETSSLSWL